MPADLKINLIADYQDGVKGMNQVTESIDYFRKQLVKGKEVSKQYYDAVSRDLQVLGRHGNTIKSVTAQYELLTKQQKLVALELGTESEQYKALTASVEKYSNKLSKLKEQKEADLELSRRRIQMAEELNTSQRMTLSLLERAARTQGELNSKNANLGFMMLDGDRIGVATHAMREYEAILKQVIADNGINSELTRKAYAEYVSARDHVARLNEETQRKIELEKADAEELARVEKMAREVMAQMDADRLERFALSIDQINENLRQMEEQERSLQQTNANNAELGFMAVTGDEVGMATYTLRQYEQELKNVIASTGINSQQTKVAAERYREQKEYVDELNESMRANNTTTKQATKTTGGYLTRLVTLAKNILVFQLILGPIRKLINGISNTIRESMQVAAEAEQTFSKLATVFDGLGEASKGAAEELSNLIGVAGSTAASALSTVGDLLQAQGMGTAESLKMAEDWVQVFQDIIAFKDINMSLEEFAQNFMSGAAGNLRNFRTFGSIVKESAVQARLAAEGLDGLTGEQLELAKMTTRANMALEQQKNAIGATKREWDTMLSVNRRLNESWKETKEIIGSFLNTTFKGLKSDLTDLLDTLNKTYSVLELMKTSNLESAISNGVSLSSMNAIINAADTLKGGSEGPNLWQRFMVSSLKTATDTSFVGSVAAGLNPMALIAKLVIGLTGQNAAEINANANAYLNQGAFNENDLSRLTIAVETALNVGFEDAVAILKEEGYKISDDIKAAAKTIHDTEIARQRNVDAQSATIKSLTERGYNVKDYVDTINNLVGTEGLKSYMSSTNFAGELSADYLLGKNKGTAGENIEDAVAFLVNLAGQLDTAYSSAYANKEAYTAQKDSSWKNLLAHGTKDENGTLRYDSSKGWTPQEWNNEIAIYKNALTMIEQVNTILDLWTDLYGDAIDQITELYARQSYNNLLTSTSGTTSSYGKMTSRIGMSEKDIAIADIDEAYNAFLASQEALYMTGIELEALADSTEEARKAIRLYYHEQDVYAQKQERDQLLATYRAGGANDYVTQLANFGKTDAQLTRNAMLQAQAEAAANLDVELFNAIQDQIDAFDELQRKTEEEAAEMERLAAVQSIVDSVNPFSGTMQAWKTGQTAFGGTLGSVGGGIVGILADILSQTEAFSKMAAIVSDYIVPAVDNLLSPLLPVVEMMGETLGSLIDSLLKPVIVPALTSLVIGMDIVSRILSTIASVVNTIYYAVSFQWNRISTEWGGWLDDQKRQNEATKQALEGLSDIAAGIKNDTGKLADDELSILKDLYSRGIISEDQFYAGARVVQADKVFDPVSADSTKYVASRAAGTGTTVSYGNITFNISGNAEEISRVIYRILDGENISYNTALGGAY